MISMMVVFYMFLVLFSVVGGLRGWAKELLVIFSVILAFFFIFLLERFVPFIRPFTDVFATGDGIVSFASIPAESQSALRMQFWIRTLILIVLVFFGYQTPNISRISAAARREKVQDFILGLFLGLINGYLIFGTLWSYMDSASYPFEPFIVSPTELDPLGQTALSLIERLPPMWLGGEPWIYIAVAVAFLFVIVVFI